MSAQARSGDSSRQSMNHAALVSRLRARTTLASRSGLIPRARRDESPDTIRLLMSSAHAICRSLPSRRANPSSASARALALASHAQQGFEASRSALRSRSPWTFVPKRSTVSSHPQLWTIRYYAETATNPKHRRVLSRLADGADALAESIGSMPEWARDDHCRAFGLGRPLDTRVTVAAKAEHDGLAIDSWTSKKGLEMHRVHWADGTATEYTGSLSRNYVNWDR